MSEVLGPDETLDILCNERLRIIQKKQGYRFSIDAILLAHFVVLKKHERLLDIGTGCGIIPAYIVKKGYRNEMVGVEIQKDLYDVALKNKILNNCDQVTFLHGDIGSKSKDLKTSPFHVVVSNPPYTKERSGRTSPQPSRLVARYESFLNLESLVSIAASLLYKKGRFYVIYPSRRLGEIISAARDNKLELKRVRFIHPRKKQGSNLFLAEFIKDGGIGTAIEAPLYIYENGQYTDEVKGYYILES
ncbi:MAG: tRNA1(Val) (adenine(37)-N6)-methyltransferase [Syntrophorhabdus sp. PtaU1.Bin002]|nr:MAG: tRNA1(Val) (adenine(37)-N6)-methyltransferase [Syntrophorhabdus sp. PtaB.Bin006]OPY73111.1 MAG: tRNA1(Val) (adenine(37)-N6)-methyltransferase [Syntrophorhabdus sp. PtaU1.Bin002]